MCSPKRKMWKHKELVWVQKFMGIGTKKVTSSQKLCKRVMKPERSWRRDSYKHSCSMLLMRKNLRLLLMLLKRWSLSLGMPSSRREIRVTVCMWLSMEPLTVPKSLRDRHNQLCSKHTTQVKVLENWLFFIMPQELPQLLLQLKHCCGNLIEIHLITLLRMLLRNNCLALNYYNRRKREKYDEFL